jgi:hypothetical protein
MRKLIAIFMLAVFAFNVAGYQLLYNYMTNRSNAALELALDENKYNDQELISIKQSTNLPYYTNSKDYQRIDGEVEIDGVQYKYVKCRIYNDSLEMLCIPNKAKMQLEQSKNEYAKLAHDFQQAGNKKKNEQNKSAQKSISEYEGQTLYSIAGNVEPISSCFILVNEVPGKTFYFTTVEQPPDVAVA